MSTRYSGTRTEKHLILDDSHKSAIKDHLRSYHQFKILRKCHIDYDAKIHEALLIKRTKATTKLIAIWKSHVIFA